MQSKADSLKFAIGGLAFKAKLEEEDKAVLYGIMLEAYEALHSEEGEAARNRWKIMGDIAFTRDKKFKASS